MKKTVFALVMALASISLVSAPMLRAQDSITIKDPAEYNTYTNAIGQTDPKTKAQALEGFLTTYPQSVVKSSVLDTLIDAYYQDLRDADKTLSAATRLLQADPSNMKAILYSVIVKKSQCVKTSDAQTCNDTAALAQKGLSVSRPAGTSADDWKKMTSGTYPIFHSAIALDDIVSKKDINAGIAEYRTELMLYPPEQTTVYPSAGLWDTLQLAEAYTKATTPDHLVQAVWFYARAWNFAAPLKAPIEKKMNYYYTKYHGNLDGLDVVKAQAAATLFPPGTFVISAKATPAELAHKAMMETPDLSKMALVDTEFILANGAKEDTGKLWAVLKDQVTPVPGIVTGASTMVKSIKVVLTQEGKATDYIVNLTALMVEKDIPVATSDFAAKKAFILTKGVAADTNKFAAILNDDSKPAPMVVIEANSVFVIMVAVTADAKTAKVADFFVCMKKPLEEKDIPKVGFEFKIPPATTLIGIYDSFTALPAKDETTDATAQIVLRDGEIQADKKKPAAAGAHPKPAAGHKPSAAH